MKGFVCHMVLGCVRRVEGEKKEWRDGKGNEQSSGGEGEQLLGSSARDRCEAVRRNSKSEQWEIGRRKSSKDIVQSPSQRSQLPTSRKK